MITQTELRSRIDDIYISHSSRKCLQMATHVLKHFSDKKLANESYKPIVYTYNKNDILVVIPMHNESETRFLCIDSLAIADIAKLLTRFGDSSFCSISYTYDELTDICWKNHIPVTNDETLE